MNKQSFPKLPLVAGGTILLLFLLLHFIAWQVLILIAFIALFVFAFLGHLRLQVIKEQQQAAIPHYQPPQAQEPIPLATPITPPLGFDLTATEYNQLAQHYQQGYQGAPRKKYEETGLPKQENPSDYEMPQAQYPDQLPPMTTY